MTSPLPEPSPRLLVVIPRDRAFPKPWEPGGASPNDVLLIEDGVVIFQLIGGKWELLYGPK